MNWAMPQEATRARSCFTFSSFPLLRASRASSFTLSRSLKTPSLISRDRLPTRSCHSADGWRFLASDRMSSAFLNCSSLTAAFTSGSRVAISVAKNSRCFWRQPSRALPASAWTEVPVARKLASWNLRIVPSKSDGFAVAHSCAFRSASRATWSFFGEAGTDGDGAGGVGGEGGGGSLGGGGAFFGSGGRTGFTVTGTGMGSGALLPRPHHRSPQTRNAAIPPTAIQGPADGLVPVASGTRFVRGESEITEGKGLAGVVMVWKIS